MEQMHKLVLSLAAVAAALTLSAPAGAMPVGNSGLAAALQDMSIAEQVHCRPGWEHHRPTEWRRRDGCQRRGGGGAVIGIPGGPGLVVPLPGVRRGGDWCHQRGTSRNYRC
jgi:hypothetical protein